MIQVLELRKVGATAESDGDETQTGKANRYESKNVYDFEAGKGQQIEEEMAQQVGVKVFVAKQPCTDDEPKLPFPFTDSAINVLVETIKEWDRQRSLHS